jgi:hypothetical protein
MRAAGVAGNSEVIFYIEIASPADSRTGMWSAYQGGKILAVKFGLRALLDRLDELLPD